MLTGNKEQDKQEYLRLFTHEVDEMNLSSRTGEIARFERGLWAAQRYMDKIRSLDVVEVIYA